MHERQANFAAKILIPLDGSDPANRAIDFAVTIGGSDADYTLLHVLPQPNGSSAAAVLVAASVRLRDLAPDARQETALRTGDPASIIVKEAQERSAGLIVMASRGRESAHEESFGSTVDRVVRTSPTPVLVVRDRAGDVLGPKIYRIIVPLDGSRRADQAVPVAGRIAMSLGVPVKFVTVVDPKRSFPPSLAYEAAQSGAFFEEILAGLRHELAAVHRQATKALKRLGVDVDSVLRYGLTIPTIIDETAPGDLMVMTSHGQGVGKHWMLGSVSEKLLREARLPIVLLRSQPEPDVSVFAVDEALGLQPVGSGRR